MEQLSRAQLLVVVIEQAALIVGLTGQVEVSAGQVADLSARVRRNSQNFSMPPRSDRFIKPVRPVRRKLPR